MDQILSEFMPAQLEDHEILAFRRDLFRDLRMEMDQLKSCQSNSIMWGVAAAATIISILTAKTDISSYPYFLLLPLLVIYPSWIIFFDKSRTISRLTAFLRLQEKLAAAKSRESVIGWETALEEYWRAHEKFKDKNYRRTVEKALQHTPESRKKISSHIYWYTGYLVFFSLSVLSLLSTALFIPYNVIIVIILLAILLLFIDLKHDIGKNDFGFSLWCLNNSFREVLDFVSRYLKKYFIIQIGFLVLVIIRPDVLVLSASSIDPVTIGLFILFLGFFIVISLITAYIFLNLIQGRYAVSAYEFRWMSILEIDLEMKQQIKRSLTPNSELKFPTDTQLPI